MELIIERDGRETTVHLESTAQGWEVKIDDRVYQVDAARVRGPLHSLLIEGVQHEVAVHNHGKGSWMVSHPAGLEEIVVMDPIAHLARQVQSAAGPSGPKIVKAQMPGRVVKIFAEEGASVDAEAGVVVLEAMKMENEISADFAGVVSKIFVEAGQAVEGGDPLFELTPPPEPPESD